jgi:hypothetical protein
MLKHRRRRTEQSVCLQNSEDKLIVTSLALCSNFTSKRPNKYKKEERRNH